MDPTDAPAPSPAGTTQDGMPRWVLVFAIAAVVLVAAFLLLHLAGLGFRGH